MAAIWVGSVATLLGCSLGAPSAGDGGGSASAPSAAASAGDAGNPKTKLAGIVNGLPITDAEIQKFVNPTKLPVYTGPTAIVRGTVTIKGDQPPPRSDVLAKITDVCAPARGVYERLFREGMMRAVADALVTVTGYSGKYVPPEQDSVTVVSRDCAWDRLTIGVMMGQRLEVATRGRESAMPELVGAPTKALLVALPRGKPVRLYPLRPGRYSLIDRMHPGLPAEVFVLNVPTFDVTGLDGRYEIERVPPGELTVMATLPVINKSVRKTLKVEAGKTYDVNLELEFDAEKDVPKVPAN